MIVPLESHLDEGPEDDLEADRELERSRRLSRQHSRPVQDVLRENQEDLRLIRGHHYPLRTQLLTRTRDLREPYNIYILYNKSSRNATGTLGPTARVLSGPLGR